MDIIEDDTPEQSGMPGHGQENLKDEKHLEKFSKEEKQVIKLMAKIFTEHFFRSMNN